MFLSPTIGCAVNHNVGVGRNPNHTRSLGGGGIFNTNVPTKPFNSTFSPKSVFETPIKDLNQKKDEDLYSAVFVPSMAFLM